MSFSGSTFARYKRALIITGVFMLVLGGAFVVMAGSIPFAGGGFMLTAGILGLIGVVLIVVGILAGRSAEATERVLQSGIAGQAQGRRCNRAAAPRPRRTPCRRRGEFL